ncbi:DEAD-domain-containing protein [Trametes versicolor FP-101664 SS1]|uniref:DEAD-domain-containing protein n=1 Tax=Trametes versicolor (strain FP-101664) TaxID=717944 RepID=UPI000462205D|nr:DEAD-domain-containing protein [Trametes versicolor FP-101664 SS1]EIW55511.1 DEAD-domain-containing protein [Trametes versicolor FP-101664 SS1]
MAASLWSKSLALLPAARICRCPHGALAQHSLRAGRFTSVRSQHTEPTTFTEAEPVVTREENVDAESSEPLVEEAKPEKPPVANHDQPKFETLQGVASPLVLQALVKSPFRLTHMSPVQAAVLPLLPKLLEDHDAEGATGPRDLLVKARTGTGKTLAFLIPAVEARLKRLQERSEWAAEELQTQSKPKLDRVVEQYARENVGAIIISPTRELATQIANEALKLTRHLDRFQVRLLVGGLPKRAQLREWNTRRRDIVVATPGRLRDCIENEPRFADEIKTAEQFILDEADTLLDMGFREDLQAITEVLKPSPERQTFMFSATVSKPIQQIARKTLAENHKFINCVPDNALPTHMSIPQYYTGLPSAEDQIPHILNLIAHDQLSNPGKSKVLVFLPTTALTQLYSSLLQESGNRILPVGSKTRWGDLHSRMTMSSRMRVSDWYRKDKSGASVLVTSDVSARGVDYPGVTRVIQVGIPSSGDVYVHRVGRTGRGSNMSGRADLVLMPWELGFLTWQLKDIPLKELTTNQLKEQVLELAQKVDASIPEGSEYHRQAVPTLENMETHLEAMQGRASEEDVRTAMVSVLAYYTAQHQELRVQMGVVSRGAHQWAAALLGKEVELRLPREFTVGNRSSRGSRDSRGGGGYRTERREGHSSGGFRGRERDGERSGRRSYDGGDREERSFRPRREDGEERSFRPRRDDGEERSFRPRREDGERSFPRHNREDGDASETRSYRPRRNDSDPFGSNSFGGERRERSPRREGSGNRWEGRGSSKRRSESGEGGDF